MIKIVNGDILKSGAPYICHQVNCMGVMGAGVAKQIKMQYPRVFSEYHNLCMQYKHNPSQLLGDAQIVTPSIMESTPHIVNLFGQVGYSRVTAQTNLPALQKACEKIAYYVDPTEIIAMPYRIGCGLAGGNWADVIDMLEAVFKDRSLYLYKL